MKAKKVIVLLVTLASIFGIYWINAGKTVLKTTAEVAGREEAINYTLPPGFVFSIWGIIYLGFLVYAIYGLGRPYLKNTFFDRITHWVSISMLLNLLWVTLTGLEWWIYAFFLQWLMLVIAIRMLLQWQLGQRPLTRLQKWMSLPFALYAGWLTTAMIPFIADLLNKSGWNYSPFAPVTWAVIIYVVACAIVLLAYKRLQQPFYIIPLAWALVGLSIRFDGILRTTAAFLAGILLAVFLIRLKPFLANPAISKA